VLVAEDTPTIQTVLRYYLERAGLTVEVAENGRAAVERALASEFDVILMDMQMPEMDGFEATGEIRKREVRTGLHVPIVALTAHAMKGDRERCLEAGMDGYLSKPIRAQELYELLENYIALRASSLQAPEHEKQIN
jgi:two-component system, sensor histidine kinase and response regulator